MAVLDEDFGSGNLKRIVKEFEPSEVMEIVVVVADDYFSADGDELVEDIRISPGDSYKINLPEFQKVSSYNQPSLLFLYHLEKALKLGAILFEVVSAAAIGQMQIGNDVMGNHGVILSFVVGA